MEGTDGAAVADDGCRLWMEEAGRGVPLVLCHGGPGLWDMFAPLVPPLSERARVIRWDQRGCGRSDHRGPYSVSRSVADLDAVRSHLGLDQMVVAGHSWGATLALRYALDHQDRVSALIYISGTGLGWEWREPFRQNAAQRLAPNRNPNPNRNRINELRAGQRGAEQDRELAIRQWSAEFATGDAMGLAEQMATPWFAINRESYEAIWAELEQTWREPELVAACRTLAVPVLIVDGAQDLRPRWAVDSLAQALPSVTRVVLPEAGHMPWLDAPDEFLAALLDFLCLPVRHQRRVKQAQCPGVRVELGGYADGEGLELAAVTDVGPGDHRHAEVGETLGQDRLDAGSRTAVREGAGDDTGHTVQVTRTPQLSQHPVDPVVLFVDVFDQHDPAAGRP